MTVDWAAALVAITGAGMLCAAFTFITSLIVKGAIADLHKVFVPRKEADLKDKEYERRLQAAGV